jgi:hypothetical protein
MKTTTPFQFGLSSLLLLTTYAAIVMSIAVMVPIIGIALAIMSVPALIRAYIVVRAYRKTGYALTHREKVRLFFAGLAVAYVIFLLSGIATVFVGLPIALFLSEMIGSSARRELVFGYVGAAVGVAVLVYLLRLWFKFPADRFGVWKSRAVRRDKESP